MEDTDDRKWEILSTEYLYDALGLRHVATM